MRRLHLVLFFFLCVFSVLSGQIHPPGDWPVRDEINQLDSNSLFAVRRICTELKRNTSAELVVLIIRTTSGEDPQNFGVRLFNQWGIGRSDIDDGVLLLFAMSDRRVEIIPGERYKSIFPSHVCTALLTQHAIPKMKAGRAQEGVINAATEIARRVRDFESGRSGRPMPAENPSVKPSVSSNRPGINYKPGMNSRPVSVPSRPMPSPTTSPSQDTTWKSRSSLTFIVRIVFFVVMTGWALMIFLFFRSAFVSGVLLFPKWAAFTFFGTTGAALAFFGYHLLNLDSGLLDQLAAGTGGTGLLALLYCGSHICPRCNKWLSISDRTLVSATYSSSGRGERTEHCQNCRYHNVYTYTISRKTRSSSRSSSSGGGRSSGGGGGASW